MGWTLSPGVGYCRAGDELIFLDLRHDRYLALRGKNRDSFERLRSCQLIDGDAMTQLCATGLIARHESGNRLDPPAIKIADRDLGAEPVPRLQVRMLAAATRHLFWARKAMRSERLAATIAGLAVQRPANMADCDGAMALLASSYFSTRAFVPIAPRCLIDSLALFQILIRRGLSPTMVFGVKTSPFAAHCWLQSSTMILTGSLDDAQNFQPILAI